ncbi:MAG: hypothetical protein ACHQQQ_08095 [Bacteroidota bacterium]
MTNIRFSKALNHGLPKLTTRRTEREAFLSTALTGRNVMHKLRWGIEDIAFKYFRPGDYENIAHLVNTPRKKRETYITKFVQPIEELFTESKLRYTIEGRPKHLYSIYSKMITRNKSFQEISDLYAIRIVLQTEDPYDCFRAYDILSRIYLPLPGRFKDYIFYPKKNGYQSIHTTLIGLEGKNVEVQIRTLPMQHIAQEGGAAHRIYKENGTPRYRKMENWTSWMNRVLNLANLEPTVNHALKLLELRIDQKEIAVLLPGGGVKIFYRGVGAGALMQPLQINKV